MELAIKLTVSPRLPKAISALANILERFPDSVDLLVDFRKSFVEAGCIDLDRMLTARAFDGGVCFEPSDRLLDFLFATWAGYFDSFAVDAESHGSSFHE